MDFGEGSVRAQPQPGGADGRHPGRGIARQRLDNLDSLLGTDGQILEEGISEAGAISSWTAAATSYSVHGQAMLPFYIYYSMFGFQRIGDLAWAAGDMQARGFLLGGTSGRTTLNGEGLQHEDGHSHILAGTIPNCVSYDPTFAHEVGVILHHGLKRMVEKQDNVFYYLTLLNENYAMPGLQPGTEEQIIKGMYLCKEGAKLTPRVQLLGSGTILRESIAAQALLDNDHDIDSARLSVTAVGNAHGGTVTLLGDGSVRFEPLADFSQRLRDPAARDARLREAMQAYVARLEALCHEHPYNWFNFHDFWHEQAH